MKKSFADILSDAASDSRRRMKTKAPSWYACEDLIYPESINVEQCSSESAALWKASLSRRIISLTTGLPDFRIADMTGGLGVDSWAFARSCTSLLYNERNPRLLEAVKANFEKLGLRNVLFSNVEICPGSVASALGDFAPDIIYLDPARRSSSGAKVFLLEDCSPDILSLYDELASVCRNILIKLSPMADITMILSRLSHVRELHVVGLEGECKELLVWIDHEYEGAPLLYVDECRTGDSIVPDEVNGMSGQPFPEGENPGLWLFEPGAALMKSARHDGLCASFGLAKLDRFTHLYFAASPVPDLTPFGKWFRVCELFPFDKRGMRDVSAKYPRTEVTARNVPVSSDELRKRLKVSPSSQWHVFAVSLSDEGALSMAGKLFASIGPGRIILATSTDRI